MFSRAARGSAPFRRLLSSAAAPSARSALARPAVLAASAGACAVAALAGYEASAAPAENKKARYNEVRGPRSLVAALHAPHASALVHTLPALTESLPPCMPRLPSHVGTRASLRS